MYKVIKCQICPWKIFFPMKSVCIYILFPKSPHWKANGRRPSDSLFGHWGTWLYYVFLHHININGLDICFNSRFLNTSWRKVLNLVFNLYFISIKWGVKSNSIKRQQYIQYIIVGVPIYPFPSEAGHLLPLRWGGGGGGGGGTLRKVKRFSNRLPQSIQVFKKWISINFTYMYCESDLPLDCCGNYDVLATTRSPHTLCTCRAHKITFYYSWLFNSSSMSPS